VSRLTHLIVSGIAWAALGLTACTSAPTNSGTSASPSGPASRSPAADSSAHAGNGAPAAAATPSDGSGEYIIGPGDALKIVVSQNPELNADVPVRPDGKITTPLANDVIAVGKTPTELAHDIETALSQYLRKPSVSVIVSKPVGTFGQVRVVGRGVINPKGIPYRNGMTVLDLIQEVGGLSQFAAGNRAKIIRSDRQGTREIKVRLDDLLNKGRIAENVALQPGDILVVPESWF